MKSVTKLGIIAAAVLIVGLGALSVKLEPVPPKDVTIETPDLKYPVTLDKTKLPVKKKLLKEIKATAANSIFLIDEISNQSVATALARLLNLDAMELDAIYLFIDSPGGDVVAGEMLVSAMESSKTPVYTVCISMCASMGAIIHAYGKERYAFDRAILMYHDAKGGARGELDQMSSLINMFQRKIDKSDSYIVSRSKMTWDEFFKVKSADLWIDSEDAKDKGLVDNLVKYPHIISYMLTNNEVSGRMRRNRMLRSINIGTGIPVEVELTN